MHGTTMVFLVVMPLWAGFANYVVPLQIGARDMAFPKPERAVLLAVPRRRPRVLRSVFFAPPEAGWTAYTPLSTGPYIPGNGTDAWIFLIHLTGHQLDPRRAQHHGDDRQHARARAWAGGALPLFCWSMLAQAIMILLTLPVIAGAVTMLLTDRHFGTCFFDPRCGGSALLWQHLFWFFGHPEVYIMILPAFGVISEVLPVFARKPIFGYKAIAASSIGIAFLSMLVWAHHMFATPLPAVVLAFFMLSSMAIAIPTGVKILNWVATLFRGSIVLRTPLYFAAGFLVLFTLGGITGVMLAIFPIDRQVTDTYFVVAHFHFVLVAGAVSGVMAGAVLLVPEDDGPACSPSALGKLSFWLQFVGFLGTFLIQHSLGLSGMPRRIYTYRADTGWGTDNLISTVGAFILATGVLSRSSTSLWSLRHGRRGGPGPVEGQHAGVVHDVAAAGAQLRRRSRACGRSSRCATSAAASPSRPRAGASDEPGDRARARAAPRRDGRRREGCSCSRCAPGRREGREEEGAVARRPARCAAWRPAARRRHPARPRAAARAGAPVRPAAGPPAPAVAPAPA